MRAVTCVNDVTLLGRVGNDPQESSGEKPVLTFPFATGTNSRKFGRQRLLVKGHIRYKNIDTSDGPQRLATIMAHTIITVDAKDRNMQERNDSDENAQDEEQERYH
ncbi:hypothetical protein CAPTEDRAFT_194630 [Capitella teleta]|uniref:Single-stranded DNA-binding protein n=1 Tax=Capitella teleta TaxID=283909 RepID=R7V2M7_CAPTE|nr:hypothetical protein CAPTEDRAFT_194630 [Capitella teleta]|eukprot:ELU09961.1 hypothetical protein CAPTEDRAFT_194630 [Capitella teleta]